MIELFYVGIVNDEGLVMDERWMLVDEVMELVLKLGKGERIEIIEFVIVGEFCCWSVGLIGG